MGDSLNHEEEGEEGERKILDDVAEPNMLLQVSSCFYLFLDWMAQQLVIVGSFCL